MGMQNRKELLAMKYKPGMRIKPVLTCGPGVTKQEFAKETDINHIMARYPGIAGQVAFDPSSFADVSEIGSFRDVLERVHAAEVAFLALPPRVRERFHQNPAELVEFLEDSKNRPEAISLGLIAEKKEPAPAVAEGPAQPVTKPELPK